MDAQKKKLVDSLVLVVNNVRKPEALTGALQGLGARHVKYGALPEHYPLVGNSLLKTFEQYLGSDWTPEVKQAWVDAYGAITTLMLEGADYSQAAVQLDAAPPASAAPEPAAPNPLQVETLEQSFEKIKPQAAEFSTSFYENLFTDYPDAKPLFANTDMDAQKKKLVDSLVLVVNNVRKPEALTGALQGLGARHVKYGALPEHYPLVGNSLLKTFEQYLGSDWTPEVKQAWVDAYGAITTLMLEGADYSQAAVQLDAAPPASAAPEPAAVSEEQEPADQSKTLLVAIAGGLLTVGIIVLILL